MIIDGRTIANHILAQLLTRVDDLQEKYGVQPHMAVIRVGDDPAITSYINQKAKKAKEIGAVLSVYNFPENVIQKALKESIDFLQEKSDIHGLILQLPVPKAIDYEQLILDIHPDKDIDGFRPNSPFTIPIAAAILKILELVYVKELQKLQEGVAGEEGIPPGRTEQSEGALAGGKRLTGPLMENSTFHSWLVSKNIVVMGKGKTGGAPIIDILKEQGVAVHVIDSSTTHVADITQEADIIITAIGKPHILTPDMIKKDLPAGKAGAILLGVGMSMDENGKFVGDYDEEEMKEKASWYTPIPGGVGPVNVACLLENLVIAAEKSV